MKFLPLAATFLIATRLFAASRFGLFVGINEFDGVGNLSACDWDAACIYDAWTTSGGCQTANACLLANRRATKAAVRDRILSLADKAQPGDTLLFFFSTHGDNHVDEFGNDTKNAYLRLTDEPYEDWEFADDLLKFAPGVNVVVLIDACNSAGMFMSSSQQKSEKGNAARWHFASGVRSRMDGKLARRKQAAPAPNIAFVTAANWNEPSFETYHRHGEFTLAILDGWANALADSDGDASLTFLELAAFAENNVLGSSVQYSNETLLNSITAGKSFDTSQFRLICADGFLAGFYGSCPTSLQLPDGIFEIGWSAFDCDYSDASSLESVTLPASLEKIDSWAFYRCANLANVVFPGDFTAIDCPVDAFSSTPVLYSLLGAKNDALADAIEISGQSGSVRGRNIGATRLDPIDALTSLGAATVWWKWTAPATGMCSFDTFGSSFDTRLSILAQEQAGFVLIAENDDSPYAEFNESRATFQAQVGAMYLIGVSGYRFTEGDIVLNWLLECADPDEPPEWVSVEFDPTGSGTATTVELVLGQPYTVALNGLEPQPARHGQAFDSWLINGLPLSPGMCVADGDFITASWRELASNPLCPSETDYVDASVQNIYDGYVLDKFGACVGSVRLKVGKANARTHLASVTATVQLLNARKLAGFKAMNGGKVNFSANSPASAIILVKAGHPEMTLKVGHDGMSGIWGDYVIAGVRNVSKANADGYQQWIGAWGVALAPESASGRGAAFADGYSFISVSVAPKGKVKVTGVMADGSKVNCSSQLLIAKGGNEACVCVIAPLSAGKSGGIGFVLWLAKDGSASPESLNVTIDKNVPLIAHAVPAAAAKLTPPPASLTFSLDADAMPQKINGAEVLRELLPSSVAVSFANGKFAIAKPNKIKLNPHGGAEIVGATDNDAALKLSYAAKSGVFKGSFSVYTLDGNRLKKLKATISGGFLNDIGYGSALIKSIGSFPLLLQ